MIDLTVDLGKGLRLANPLLPASGTFGFGDELPEWGLVAQYGGLITKSVTLNPRAGNPPPRIAETTAGMLNSIGLANPGIEAFIARYASFYRQLAQPVIVNIAGSSFEEYLQLAAKLEAEDWVAALEVNVSCPNVKEGGIEFGREPRILGDLIKRLRQNTTKYLIVKLTPNVSDVGELAAAAADSGADAVALINTVYGAAIDIVTRRPKIQTVIGGYSGPAIKPIALAQVIKVYRRVSIPIIGIGGITTGADVIEFMLAGARAVELGTVNFTHPFAPREIIGFLEAYCQQQGITCLSSIVGAMRSD